MLINYQTLARMVLSKEILIDLQKSIDSIGNYRYIVILNYHVCVIKAFVMFLFLRLNCSLVDWF